MSAPGEEQHAYCFGDFTLDTGRGALLKDGAEIRLRPQSFQVLKILVERHGNLVTRDELQAAVWGHKVVTDDSLAHCLIDVRKALGDGDRKIIRTVPRRGYIFDAPVADRDRRLAETAPPSSLRQINKGVIAAAAVAIVAIITLWLADVSGLRMLSPAPKNSLAVLPFADMSETQDQQYIGDGLSDEILSLLARSPELRVIARTSSFSFADETPDIATIRDTLNVAFVLEGSVRRTRDRLRVTAQLIDTSDSSNIWSESYERRPDELLLVQKEIAEAVLWNIAPATDRQLAIPARRNFSSNELMLLASYYEQEVREQLEVDEDVLAEAVRLYRDAVEADPDSALAHSRLARALLYGGDLSAAEAPIFRALTLNPNLSEVQETLGRYYWLRGLPGAGAAWKRATELNPNNADALSSYAYWYWMQGIDDGPEEMFRRALELDPLSLARHAALGEFLAHQARLDKTAKVIERVKAQFDGPQAYRVIARLLELTGDVDQSIAWTIRARDLEPENSDHISALAELYAEIGDFDTALALDPDRSIGLLYKMRRYDELIDVAEIRMIDEPSDIYLRYLLAFAYNATGRSEAALRILRTMGQPDTAMPESRQALDIEAFVSYMDALDVLGQTAKARELALWFDTKSHTENDNWWIHVYRACSLAVLGRDEMALQRLERVAMSPRLPWDTVLKDSPCFRRYAVEPRYTNVLDEVDTRRARLRERLPDTLLAHNVLL